MAFNPIQHLLDALVHLLRASLITKHQWPTSNALVTEWKQIPAARFQNLKERLSRRVETVLAAD